MSSLQNFQRHLAFMSMLAKMNNSPFCYPNLRKFKASCEDIGRKELYTKYEREMFSLHAEYELLSKRQVELVKEISMQAFGLQARSKQ